MPGFCQTIVYNPTRCFAQGAEAPAARPLALSQSGCSYHRH